MLLVCREYACRQGEVFAPVRHVIGNQRPFRAFGTHKEEFRGPGHALQRGSGFALCGWLNGCRGSVCPNTAFRFSRLAGQPPTASIGGQRRSTPKYCERKEQKKCDEHSVDTVQDRKSV